MNKFYISLLNKLSFDLVSGNSTKYVLEISFYYVLQIYSFNLVFILLIESKINFQSIS
jgi:hypothetical protein